MGLKLAAMMAVVLAVVCGGFYWYYQDTQKAMAVFAENNAKLSVAVKTSEQAVASLQKDIKIANATVSKVNKQMQTIRGQNKQLNKRLSEHEIAFLGANKPGPVGKILTGATKKVNRCFELLSGATNYTEAERKAKNGRAFNSECPWLWPGDTITK